MNLKLIYLDEVATIEMDEAKHLIHLKWLQHPSSESFRHILMTAANLAQEKKINKWLCDMRRLVYLIISDQNWLVQNIYGPLSPDNKYGIAYIVSKEDLELNTSFRIQDLVVDNPQLNEKIQLEIFYEETYALYWLLNQSVSSAN